MFAGLMEKGIYTVAFQPLEEVDQKFKKVFKETADEDIERVAGLIAKAEDEKSIPDIRSTNFWIILEDYCHIL